MCKTFPVPIIGLDPTFSCTHLLLDVTHVQDFIHFSCTHLLLDVTHVQGLLCARLFLPIFIMCKTFPAHFSNLYYWSCTQCMCKTFLIFMMCKTCPIFIIGLDALLVCLFLYAIFVLLRKKKKKIAIFWPFSKISPVVWRMLYIPRPYTDFTFALMSIFTLLMLYNYVSPRSDT